MKNVSRYIMINFSFVTFVSISYILRMKEYERERRLLERQKRIQQAAAA